MTNSICNACLIVVREQLKELTKKYDKSENDLKALQSVGQVRVNRLLSLTSNVRVNNPASFC